MEDDVGVSSEDKRSQKLFHSWSVEFTVMLVPDYPGCIRVQVRRCESAVPPGVGVGVGVGAVVSSAVWRS